MGCSCEEDERMEQLHLGKLWVSGGQEISGVRVPGRLQGARGVVLASGVLAYLMSVGGGGMGCPGL